MSEITLPCRHRILNSNHGGLRSSTLALSQMPVTVPLDVYPLWHLSYHVMCQRLIEGVVWAVLLCKAKRQYLLTCKVSRYCLLPLHGSVAPLQWWPLCAPDHLPCSAIAAPRGPIPLNKTHSPSIGTMLGQRQRRWPSIVPMLDEGVF